MSDSSRAVAELQRLIQGIGVENPDSAIFSVDIERVEYWDVPSSRLVRLWGVVEAVAPGEVAESGDDRTIEFGDAPSGVRPPGPAGNWGLTPRLGPPAGA